MKKNQEIIVNKGVDKLSVAPMMDLTDRHCRYFHRLLSSSVLLYTEMVTTGAVIYGDHERLLGYNPAEHPLALQLGGGEPDALAQSAEIGADWGYDEINLNVGCPSDRVQKGKIGACLMREPSLVHDCISAMRSAVDIPVTVKCRLGVDDLDSYEYFRDFVGAVAESGCRKFIVHARKAWLSGLSPKQNRDVPPLHYDRVYRLKQEFPGLSVILNGGVSSAAEVKAHLDHGVDGVMLGRAAYQNPWVLTDCEAELSGKPTTITRNQIVQQLVQYIEQQQLHGVPPKRVTRHILGLFQGQPGAKSWRRTLSENAHLPGVNAQLLEQAMQAVAHYC